TKHSGRLLAEGSRLINSGNLLKEKGALINDPALPLAKRGEFFLGDLIEQIIS
ncbi:MAG: hypothetical protein H6Q64_94, partial [Firmicutes bacterium]|nr:hypothetical protein [Bacillota bacterium]